MIIVKRIEITKTILSGFKTKMHEKLREQGVTNNTDLLKFESEKEAENKRIELVKKISKEFGFPIEIDFIFKDLINKK